MRDVPVITDSAHTHTSYGLGDVALGGPWLGASNQMPLGVPWVGAANQVHQPGRMVAGIFPPVQSNITTPIMKEKPVTRRLVQVFIADPDDSVPLEQSLLYSGTQKLTDATDQELFFEIDIKAVLDIHNEKRVKLVNKKVKERTEQLEPVKIRDLKMVVVTVATF